MAASLRHVKLQPMHSMDQSSLEDASGKVAAHRNEQSLIMTDRTTSGISYEGGDPRGPTLARLTSLPSHTIPQGLVANLPAAMHAQSQAQALVETQLSQAMLRKWQLAVLQQSGQLPGQLPLTNGHASKATPGLSSDARVHSSQAPKIAPTSPRQNPLQSPSRSNTPENRAKSHFEEVASQPQQDLSATVVALMQQQALLQAAIGAWRAAPQEQMHAGGFQVVPGNGSAQTPEAQNRVANASSSLEALQVLPAGLSTLVQASLAAYMAASPELAAIGTAQQRALEDAQVELQKLTAKAEADAEEARQNMRAAVQLQMAAQRAINEANVKEKEARATQDKVANLKAATLKKWQEGMLQFEETRQQLYAKGKVQVAQKLLAYQQALPTVTGYAGNGATAHVGSAQANRTVAETPHSLLTLSIGMSKDAGGAAAAGEASSAGAEEKGDRKRRRGSGVAADDLQAADCLRRLREAEDMPDLQLALRRKGE